MSIEVDTVADYLAPPPDSFWCWQDNGEVLAWIDGTTIAFRQEVLAVVRRLKSDHLPPFDAIVLLLWGCREDDSNALSKFLLVRDYLMPTQNQDHLQSAAEIFNKLRRARNVKVDLFNTATAKAELAAVIFEEQGPAVVSPSHAGHVRSIIQALTHGLSEQEQGNCEGKKGAPRLRQAIAQLARGVRRIDDESLVARICTGVGEPVKPAPVEIPPFQAARALVKGLLDDESLGSVARLAQMLMASVPIPTPVGQHEQLPVGGVSDISNRGSLDRLLLSELANDDLTLVVRVAMREALYLRRESPPKAPVRRRVVLLDTGLRMWGTPRLFAAAVGLAIVATSETGDNVQLFSADGAQLQTVDMTTEAGLTAHLATLQPHAHPGMALPALMDQAANAGPVDVIIVTTTDTLADTEFRSAFATAITDGGYVMTVQRDGMFQLLLRSSNTGAMRVIRSAQLDLDEILARRSPNTVRLVDHPLVLPKIFSQPTFPLLVSAKVGGNSSWYVQGWGGFTLTTHGQLIHWSRSDRGATQLLDRLPFGKIVHASSHANADKAYALMRSQKSGWYLVTIVRQQSLRAQVDRIEREQLEWGFIDHQYIYVGNRQTIHAFHVNECKPIASAPLEKRRYERGRFFSAKYDMLHRWSCPTCENGSIAWTHLKSIGIVHGNRICGLFDSPSRRDFIAVFTDGRILSVGVDTGHVTTLYQLTAPVNRVEGVSHDDTRFVLHHGRNEHAAFFWSDEETLECQPERMTTPNDLVQEFHRLVRGTPMRHRFCSIGVDAAHRLVLLRNTKAWPLQFCLRTKAIRFHDQPQSVDTLVKRPFQHIRGNENPYRLRLARFADGSQALLDSRGFLHLRSSCSNLPEITIVLTAGPLSGWISNGLWFGSPYFIGDNKATDAERIYETYLRAFIGGLR